MFKLEADLRRAGFNVWVDKQIQGGHDWRDDIAVAIQNATAVLFVVSPPSVQSRYCAEEVCYASALEKPIWGEPLPTHSVQNIIYKA